MNIDIKARLRSKPFWVATISAITVVGQQLGVISIDNKFSAIANIILGLFVMLGIIVDTSTQGISDEIKVEE